MLEFFKKLFDSSDWPPRWHCGKWTEFHGWLYIISDLLIWSAYFAIPIVIIRYLTKKHDAKFIRLYILFAAFILACGATHFLDAVAFWVPMYRLSALIRFATGLISWVTVFYLIKYMPVAFSLRSQAEMEAEIDNRKAAEQQVVLLNIELDKQIKEKSAELNAYKYALDESSIVAITNQKGIITYVNENFCKISKYNRAELIGKDHRIINSKYHSKEFIKGIWTTIASGAIWKGELRNKAKDGSLYWVDTTIVPILDDSGKPCQYMAIRNDITGKKVTDEAYYRSERIYKTIASNIPGSVICIFDEAYRYVLVEGDMLDDYKLSKPMLLGNRIAEVLSEDLLHTLNHNLNRVFNDETFITEGSINNKAVITRYVPLKDNSGKVFNAMLVSIDVTALKKAQGNIEDLNKSLQQMVLMRTEQLKEMEMFSYSVSHDLRAPLRAVSGYSRILSEDYTEVIDAEGHRLIKNIMANAKKMGQLIDDLLNFSRVGRREVNFAAINMITTVKECISELSHDGEVISDYIEVEPLPNARGDGSMIRQVWMNLISNAFKYTSHKDKRCIRIGCKENNGMNVYFIKDNGAGFDMQYADKLFGIFQRLHGDEEFEGTGVGLALVERIIQKHNGKVWGEGEVNQGATFYFTLPQISV